jgi:BlaI family penicillinase repressor
MARRKALTLTEVELEFMHVIWDAGQVTTEDVQTALRRQGRALADGSIRKVLAILLAKGYLWRQPQRRGFIYGAKVPREQANRHMVLDLVKRAFGGSAALMVSTLIDGLPLSEAELRRVKRLITEREKGV